MGWKVEVGHWETGGETLERRRNLAVLGFPAACNLSVL